MQKVRNRVNIRSTSATVITVVMLSAMAIAWLQVGPWSLVQAVCWTTVSLCAGLLVSQVLPIWGASATTNGAGDGDGGDQSLMGLGQATKRWVAKIGRSRSKSGIRPKAASAITVVMLGWLLVSWLMPSEWTLARSISVAAALMCTGILWAERLPIWDETARTMKSAGDRGS